MSKIIARIAAKEMCKGRFSAISLKLPQTQQRTKAKQFAADCRRYLLARTGRRPTRLISQNDKRQKTCQTCSRLHIEKRNSHPLPNSNQRARPCYTPASQFGPPDPVTVATMLKFPKVALNNVTTGKRQQHSTICSWQPKTPGLRDQYYEWTWCAKSPSRQSEASRCERVGQLAFAFSGLDYSTPTGPRNDANTFQVSHEASAPGASLGLIKGKRIV